MLGHQSPQMDLVDAVLWTGKVEPKPLIEKGSFHDRFAKVRSTILRDEDFEHWFDEEAGRRSIPPSVVAGAFLLALREGCSDRETEQRMRYDLRWKWALGLGLNDHGCDHSSLCVFRARCWRQRCLETKRRSWLRTIRQGSAGTMEDGGPVNMKRAPWWPRRSGDGRGAELLVERRGNVTQRVEEPADGLGEMAAGEDAQDLVDVEAVRADAPEVEAGVAGRVDVDGEVGAAVQAEVLLGEGRERQEGGDDQAHC